MDFRQHALAVCCLLGLASVASAGPILDPVGDQFPLSGTGPDIVAFSADFSSRSSSGVVFTVTFGGPISAPSAGLPNSILGFIDLDTDKNPATGGDIAFGYTPPGGASWINYGVDTGALAGPPIELGAEFFIDLGSEQNGTVGLFNAFTNTPVGAVPITFAGNEFSLTVPLSLLGDPADPFFRYGVLVGDLNGSSDRAPNGAFAAAVTPEPTSLLLVGLLSAAALVRRRARAASV